MLQRKKNCFIPSGGRTAPTGRLVFLNPMSAAVEECSQKGCLALSLLELLGFNLTFVFFASLLVLIEVRCDGGEAVGVFLLMRLLGTPFFSISISEMSRH